MEESGYTLQYRIYTLAVIAWLRRVVPDFDYERDFGGIYYIYLKGMDAKNNGQGVFFYRPESLDEVRRYADELRVLLDR